MDPLGLGKRGWDQSADWWNRVLPLASWKSGVMGSNGFKSWTATAVVDSFESMEAWNVCPDHS